MSNSARIGFRLHTGWAILVAVATERESPIVLHKCRLELLPPGMGRFVYHEAAELPLPDAEILIESVRQAAQDTAGHFQTFDRGAYGCPGGVLSGLADGFDEDFGGRQRQLGSLVIHEASHVRGE